MDEFKRELAKLCANVPILPDGCKYYERTTYGELFVIEQKPAIRTIFTYAGRFRMSFPYVIFAILSRTICQPVVCMFFNKKPLVTLNDLVYEANLPNVDGTFVCISDDNEAEISSIQEVLDSFWQSRFSDDLQYNFDRMKKEPKLKSFAAWNNATNIDPSFIMNVDFVSVGCLRTHLEKHVCLGSLDCDVLRSLMLGYDVLRSLMMFYGV